jgi:hypothetical protein
MRDRRDRRQRAGEIRARLRALAEDDPLPPETRDRQLSRLRAHEPTAVRAEGPGRRSVPRRVHRRLAPLTAAATALVLFGGGGTLVAAQEAAPDDALYGLKRASEQVWVALPRGSDRAAEIRLALADRRLGEAQRAPQHAQRLVSEGVEQAEAAAEERPEEALESLGRLLGQGEGRLPDQASPRAREALHRNCTRIAAKHGLSDAPCGDAPEAGEHPGRGRSGAPGRGGIGRGEGLEQAPGQLGRQDGDADGRPGRGWGPGGRPEGAVGPPPGVPAPDAGDEVGDEGGEDGGS